MDILAQAEKELRDLDEAVNSLCPCYIVLVSNLANSIIQNAQVFEWPEGQEVIEPEPDVHKGISHTSTYFR